MNNLPPALAAMDNYAQFIIVKLVPNRDRPGKTDKLPVDHRTCQVFVAGIDWQNDPAARTSAEKVFAIAAAMGDGYGIGFLFTDNDPFWFIDIDNCLMPDGSWSPLALNLVDRTKGCAVEISQSGNGLHIFGTGTVPEHACKNIAAGLELYTSRRFVALTGTRVVGDAGQAVDLTATVAHYFPPSVAVNGAKWTTEPRPEYTAFPDDEKLIAKARKSKSVANKFTGRASFDDLWTNNVAVLTDTYTPDASSSNAYDASSADMALASGLAFWTGGNCAHIENLMWLSGLVRDKWTKHKAYLRDTITRAVSLQTSVYTAGERPRASAQPVAVMVANVSNEPVIVAGFQFLAATQQLEHFAGCVYVQDVHRVFTPSGVLLKPDQFNATYGGYVFQLDDTTNGKTTKKAWEAFTESQVVRYPKATSTCFRPELPAGKMIARGDRQLVNVYVPAQGERIAGGVELFLDHVGKLLPRESDREIFISYLAACVQHPGVKFQWCIVMQGSEGNGKTVFYHVLAYALGERYAHLPNASDITNTFNSWIECKLVIGIEELHTGGRQEVADTLKPMITNKRLEIHGKGQDQKTGDNRANFIMFSNHKDAVLKTENDRRYCVFYTAQQEPSDLTRDGMNCGYFAKLYKWLEGDGFAHVAYYLAHRAVSVDVMGRAPTTSSTKEAVRSSLGVAEQLIQEAIDLDQIGFRGDLITTRAAADLLFSHGKKLGPQKVTEVIKALGYIRHPALDGSGGKISMGGVRHRMYVKRGSLTAHLTTTNKVADAWMKTNGGFAGIVQPVGQHGR